MQKNRAIRTGNLNIVGKRIAQVILLAGGLLRILVYFQNRSLFLDEANLSRNIVEKSFLDFFSPLAYHQYAPPLFSCFEKINVLLLGPNELALRLFPLIGSLFTLYLFYLLCEKLIAQPILWWFPLSLMAFSEFFIRYATEAKQYGTDAFSTCLLLLIALRISKNNKYWIVIGGLMIWFSMPAVFILAGVGCYYLYPILFKETNSTPFSMRLASAKWILIAIIIWLISFGGYYLSILNTDLGKDYLLDYHKPYFIPLFPTSLEDLQGIGNVLLSFFNTTIGYTVYAYIIGIGCFLLGLIHLLKTDKAKFLLLFIPLLSCLFASGLHLYSLMPRLSLFLIPILLLIITKGVEYLWLKIPKAPQVLLIVALVALLPLQKGFHYYFQPYEIEAIRPVLAFVQEHQKTDELVYMHTDALPAWQFYQHLHQDSLQYQLQQVRSTSAYENVGQIWPAYKEQNVWLVFSHILSEFVRKQVKSNRTLLEKTHQLEQQIELEGAAAYLYRVK